MLRGVLAKLEGFARQEERARSEEVAQQPEESFEGFRFFMPSARLAKAIMQQNQRLVSEYVERNFPPGYQNSEAEPRAEDGSLLGRLGLGMLSSPSTVDQERQAEMGKRLISERLYHYLSSLAETPRALEGGAFPLWEYLPDGMATMLGLSAYRTMPRDSSRAIEIRELLGGVTTEFRSWLVEEQNGSFVTPWIEMHLDDHDTLKLTAIGEKTADLVAAAELMETEMPEVEVGQAYVGTVTHVVEFGAFVEILPGTDGLLHISEIANHFVRDVHDELREGQQILVKCVGKDGNRIRLSRKALLRDSEDSPISETASAAEPARSEAKAGSE